MAYGIHGFDLGTVPAAIDLSALQFTAGTVTATGVNTSAAGDPADGVIQNSPEAGNVVILRTDGVSKVVAGAAVLAGAEVAVGTTGKFVTAITTDFIIGRALEAAGADGDIIAVLISKQGIKA